MRNLAAYLLAGILVVLALDFVASPVGLGLPVGAWPVAGDAATRQSVDRTTKSDRLLLSTTVDKQQAPRKSPTLMAGCDPVFSPLSASARANFAGRCVA